MKILAIDTSSAFAGVAVLDGPRVLVELGRTSRAHADVLLPMVEQALAFAELEVADIELFAVGLGPGGFTSLRVGLATTKGLALAYERPIVGVGSLRAIARGLSSGGATSVTFTDAQRGEVYAAAYRFDGSEGTERFAPILAKPEVAAEAVSAAIGEGPIVVGGDGLDAHGDALLAGLGVGRAAGSVAGAPGALPRPRAALIGAEARLEYARRGPDDLASLEPSYVRPSDAKLPAKPLRLA
jgi:tRNA threonylcarbamoyladenosine biosynthesis protein TsaB